MADVIGLVASIITIMAVLTKSVKTVKECYWASKELEALEAQVEHFSILLEGIDCQEGVHYSTAVATTLSTAKSTLEKLNQLVQVKLIKNMHGTSRVRKRAWVRNKSKIHQMQNELKELRASLTAAMGASSLSSAIRAETALNSMNHCLSNSEQTSLSLDRHLSSIQQIVTQTYDAVSAQGLAMNRLLESNISDLNCSLNLTEHQSSWPLWHRQKPQYVISRLCSDHSKEHMVTDRNLINPAEDREDGREHETPAPGPWSPFEVSQNAFPESYTTCQLLPTCCLVVLSSYELTSSAGCRTNCYSVFYRKSQRQWCRLNITIQIHESSIYWAATKVSKQRPQIKETSISGLDSELPCSLRKQIQIELQLHNEIIDDSDFRYQISQQRILQEQYKGDDNNFRQIENLPKNPCQNALAFLHDLGCPCYVENQVIQLQMLDPPSRFVSCINGILIYEIRLINSEPSIELLYNIELLHCMRGTPGLANLVGIVVDTSRKYLKGYLIEYPKARWRIDGIVQDPSTSWNRRQKWAKQLVETVAYLHSKGFLVGMICSYRMPVIIDSSDAVQFSFFKKKFAMGRTQGGYYPPEYHHLWEASQITSEAECPDITSKTDIFHLGLMLWTLASGQRMWKSLVCTRSDCKQASSCRNESHAKPNALAPLSAAIPQYYKDIVNSCVSENPGDRPAARDLLAIFTAERQLQTAQPKNKNTSNGPGCKDIIALGQGIRSDVACSRCGEGHIQQTNFFHCNVCLMNDFDICQKCYEIGAHCFDNDHLLVEIEKNGVFVVATKYHSSPQGPKSRTILNI